VQRKAFAHLDLDERCSSLESFVAVLVEHGSMMGARCHAAFDQETQQRPELTEGVARVMDVVSSLLKH
jgi:hypothetical protein